MQIVDYYMYSFKIHEILFLEKHYICIQLLHINIMFIIAHRGASGYYKANSFNSINEAIKLNSDIIEIDIRLTKDNQLVLNHDNLLVCNSIEKYIDKCNYVDIKNNIVLLDDLIKLVPNTVKFYLDIKVESNVDDFCSIIDNFLTKYPDNFFYIASFSHSFIQTFTSNCTNYTLGTIYTVLNKELLDQIFNKISFVVLDINSIDQEVFDHIKNIKIFVYTVNDLSLIEPFKNYINGIVTDYPDIILKS